MRPRPAHRRRAALGRRRLGWRWRLTLTGLALAALTRVLAPVEFLAGARDVLADVAAVVLTAAVVVWLLTAAARHLTRPWTR
jgi:glutathione S-transferase